MERMATTLPMVEANDDSETLRLVDQAAAGDQQAWAELIDRHRDRLKRMVAVRMDHRLQGRIDPSDVIQEACLVASKQIATYAANPSMPFYLWLRWITGQRLIDQHRRHLGAKARGVNREVSLYHGAFPETTSEDLAAQLMGRISTPSQEAIRIEQQWRCKTPSSRSTRSIARFSPSDISSNFPTAKRPRCSASTNRRRASAMGGLCGG